MKSYAKTRTGNRIHFLQSKNKTVCGKEIDSTWTRFLMRPSGVSACRKCKQSRSKKLQPVERSIVVNGVYIWNQPIPEMKAKKPKTSKVQIGGSKLHAIEFEGAYKTWLFSSAETCRKQLEVLYGK